MLVNLAVAKCPKRIFGNKEPRPQRKRNGSLLVFTSVEDTTPGSGNSCDTRNEINKLRLREVDNLLKDTQSFLKQMPIKHLNCTGPGTVRTESCVPGRNRQMCLLKDFTDSGRKETIANSTTYSISTTSIKSLNHTHSPQSNRKKMRPFKSSLTNHNYAHTRLPKYFGTLFLSSDIIRGSTLFITTGFNSLHVIIESTLLIVCLLRQLKLHFASNFSLTL
ncbi:hypothetical protein U0070_003015, partial [Myodes glareolus]